MLALEQEGIMSEDEMNSFENRYMQEFHDLTGIISERKRLEEMEQAIKARIEEGMRMYGVKAIDNSYVRITRVPPGEDKMTVDLRTLERTQPDVFKELCYRYGKVRKGHAAYVSYTLKG